MADAEIELPRSEADRLNSDDDAEIRIPSVPSAKDVTAFDIDQSSSKSKEEDINDLLASQPIQYHYLTFETELPYPSTIAASDSDTPPPPEQPNLSEFENPFNWSSTRKSIITWVSCIATALTAFTAGSYSPALDQMTEYWHISDVACLTGITIFTCGFAVAPMVLAPFSEINGRRPVFLVTGIIFVIMQLCCAVTHLFSGLLVARFIAGICGSTFSTMVGGVVSDIYHTKDRNTPMALFSGGALLGTGLGPLVCGFIAQHTTWRWVFYVQVITLGLIMVAIVIFFRETRGSVLLSRKAKALNQWYADRENAGYYGFDMPVEGDYEKKMSQRIRWKVKSDEERGSIKQMVTVSLVRPFHLLFTESVVFWFSLWISFSWAILYLTLAAVPLVFSSSYGFNIEQRGAVFTSMIVGAIISTVLSIYQEKWAARNGKLKGTPEDRLYFACYESALMPIGLFMFGWTSSPNIHWIVPTIAIGLATMGIFSIYLAVFNYLADCYHRYASSALAAQSFCRNMLGGAFPLITVQMYNHMGFGPASSLLGGIGAALTIVPWVLMFFGPRIRERSKFAMTTATTNQ